MTVNGRSRSARLRGAAGSAETSRLAVASDAPRQESAGRPPVLAVRKPVVRSSKPCALAGSRVGSQASARSSAAPARNLVGEAVIGDGNLEVAGRRGGGGKNQRPPPPPPPTKKEDHANRGRPPPRKGEREPGTEKRHTRREQPDPP